MSNQNQTQKAEIAVEYEVNGEQKYRAAVHRRRRFRKDNTA